MSRIAEYQCVRTIVPNVNASRLCKCRVVKGGFMRVQNIRNLGIAAWAALVLMSISVWAVAAKPPEVDDVIDAIVTEGIDLLDWTIFDAESDPNHLLGRPGQYVAKASFWDSRIGDPERDDASGTIEIFRAERDLLRRMRYVEEIGQRMPMLLQYQFRKGLILVRLDKRFTPAQAREYEQVLKSIGR